MAKLVEDLRASLHDRIEALEWMDAPTKAKAATPVAAKAPTPRTSEPVEATIKRIVTLVSRAPNGLRAEEISRMLGLSRSDMDGPISEALASGVLTKTGNTRGTTYSVPKKK